LKQPRTLSYQRQHSSQWTNYACTRAPFHQPPESLIGLLLLLLFVAISISVQVYCIPTVFCEGDVSAARSHMGVPGDRVVLCRTDPHQRSAWVNNQTSLGWALFVKGTSCHFTSLCYLLQKAAVLSIQLRRGLQPLCFYLYVSLLLQVVGAPRDGRLVRQRTSLQAWCFV